MISDMIVNIKGRGRYEFIERRQGGWEQGTPHAQRDMRGISPAICRREGVSSIYFFPNQILFEVVNRNEGACRRYAIQQRCWKDKLEEKTRSANHIQKQRDKGYKQIDKFNRNKSEQQQQRLLARLLWSILVSSSKLVTLITQQ